jgi:hypothetical protein
MSHYHTNIKIKPWCDLSKETKKYKDDWGKAGWRWGHVKAINYSQNPSALEKNIMISEFWRFINGIPCSECKLHAINYTRQWPPNFTNSKTLQTWFWRFHNYVNIRLKKPAISAEEYTNIYQFEINQKYKHLI